MPTQVLLSRPGDDLLSFVQATPSSMQDIVSSRKNDGDLENTRKKRSKLSGEMRAPDRVDTSSMYDANVWGGSVPDADRGSLALLDDSAFFSF
jgi:hypothetical protein